MAELVSPGDLRWVRGCAAEDTLETVRTRLGETGYRDLRKAFQQYICAYFNSIPNCNSKQGQSISPLAASTAGLKRLKVRWLIPGGGKRGGLRVGLSVSCANRKVIISSVQERSKFDEASLTSDFQTSEDRAD